MELNKLDIPGLVHSKQDWKSQDTVSLSGFDTDLVTHLGQDKFVFFSCPTFYLLGILKVLGQVISVEASRFHHNAHNYSHLFPSETQLAFQFPEPELLRPAASGYQGKSVGWLLLFLLNNWL